MPIQDAVAQIERFRGESLAATVGTLETALKGADSAHAIEARDALGIDFPLLRAAAAVKRASAQIDVIIHSIGIVWSLPHILAPGETIESTSLGAGNAHSDFDLVTDQRIAEFKFIHWQGGAEAIRKKNLFEDFYRLARAQSPKRKELYVLNTEIPLRFLEGRSSTARLIRNRTLADEFDGRFGERYPTVGQFYAAFKGEVKLVNLVQIVPELGVLAGLLSEESEEA